MTKTNGFNDELTLDTAVEDLFSAISSLNPMQKRFIENSWEQLSEDEQAEFSRYILFSLSSGLTVEELATAYDVIVKDTFKEQMFFKRHGHYRYSQYNEVAQAVYQNPAYMNNYMIGLAISGYLWPNHVELHRYFQHYLTQICGGQYLEIGPGHGYYFMQAAKTGKFEFCTGVDISPSSVELTRSIMSSDIYGPFSNYQIDLGDFFTWDSNLTFNTVVMAEVLEHVENPLDFLKRIHELLVSDGTAYINTCINSPAIDHIYLYSSVEELTEQVEQAGFKVREQCVVPYTGLTLQDSMKQKLPVNIAMILEK